MKHILSLLLFVTVTSLSAQTSHDLKGSWVRILEEPYGEAIKDSVDIVDKDYLKIRFDDRGQMKIYASYRANGIQLPYEHHGNQLSFGAARQFTIEQLSDDRLILSDMTEGKLTVNSKRHYYQRESVFLDALPYPTQDRVILGKDTAYLASKKLFPIFQTTDTPDFHIFIHNQIRHSYAIGENYFHATFMIRPEGSIDHVNIHHRISKGHDKRAVKAILASAGIWQIPQLNGRPVNIIMSIEDLFTRKAQSGSVQTPQIDLDYNAEDPQVYMGYFNLAIRNVLRNNPEEALKYLRLCEDRKPEDPNLHYLRYQLYEILGEKEKADQQLAKVRRSGLRYLVK